jgi:hypothetical protein
MIHKSSANVTFLPVPDLVLTPYSFAFCLYGLMETASVYIHVATGDLRTDCPPHIRRTVKRKHCTASVVKQEIGLSK